MNKAFIREPDAGADRCPRCGAAGDGVGIEALQQWLPAVARARVAEPASFCPTPSCPVVYFDGFERVVLADELARPVYPKDPDAPICACFGLTRADVERDVAEGGVTRVRAVVEKSRAPDARCVQLAANGRSCAPLVQSYYMQCRARRSAAAPGGEARGEG